MHQVSQRHESQPQRIRARYDKAVPTVRTAPLQAAYGRALSETSYESRPRFEKEAFLLADRGTQRLPPQPARGWE